MSETNQDSEPLGGHPPGGEAAGNENPPRVDPLGPTQVDPRRAFEMGAQTSDAPTLPAHWSPPEAEVLDPLFPDYDVLEILGRGGMGAVYRGVQKSLDRPVAIKVLPPEMAEADPSFAARFEREAKSMARLDHPNIVHVYDFGRTEAGHWFIVMEFVDGMDFHQLIRSGELDAQGALNAVSQICDALDYAHEQGYVHRDIKPANIFINRKGVLKVGDFGLAKMVEGEVEEGPVRQRTMLTQSGVGMGTPDYCAPEQIDGGPIDHRADIYSLGVMFYEMLTRQLPRGNFPPPSKRVEVDVRIDDVVLRAMESEPELRYSSAGEMRTEVEAVRSAPPSAAEPAPEVKGDAGEPAALSWIFLGPLLVGGAALFGAIAILGRFGFDTWWRGMFWVPVGIVGAVCLFVGLVGLARALAERGKRLRPEGETGRFRVVRRAIFWGGVAVCLAGLGNLVWESARKERRSYVMIPGYVPESPPGGIQPVQPTAGGDRFGLPAFHGELRPIPGTAGWRAEEPGELAIAALKDGVDLSAFHESLPVGLGGVVSLVKGKPTTKALLAILEDGSVRVWGEASTDSVRTFGEVEDRLTDVVAADLHAKHGIALRRDGTVVAWPLGSFAAAQLNGAGLREVVSVCATWHALFAVTSDGTLHVFGEPSRIESLPQLENVRAVSGVLATDAILVLHRDGSLSHAHLHQAKVYEWVANFPSDVGPVRAFSGSPAILLEDGRVIGWQRQAPWSSFEVVRDGRALAQHRWAPIAMTESGEWTFWREVEINPEFARASCRDFLLMTEITPGVVAGIRKVTSSAEPE